MSAALDIPLPEDDPGNVHYFRSPAFLQMLLIYMLTPIPNSSSRSYVCCLTAAPLPAFLFPSSFLLFLFICFILFFYLCSDTSARRQSLFLSPPATASDIKSAPAAGGAAADEPPLLTPQQKRQLIADLRAKKATATKVYESLLTIALTQEPNLCKWVGGGEANI